MTTAQTAQLTAIADRLAKRSDDPQALGDFHQFVQSISKADRVALVDTLQAMIREVRIKKDGAI